MARHLTDNDISNIVEILDDWSTDTKLSWDRLVEAVEHECKFRPTRQTLEKQVRIKVAFTGVKALVAGRVPTDKLKVPPSLKVAAERLEKQQRKIERLERENQQLLEQAQVWLYNAYRFGVTIEQLSESLPRKDNQ